MPYFQTGASHIYYETHGRGLPVVMLHGVGGNHASWFYQLTGWAQRFQLITFDARGFGKSTDAESLGRSAFTEDLTRLLDHLGIQRAALVAQSMGGGTAVDFTCRFPERVCALVLADTLVWLDPPPEMAADFLAVQVQTQNLNQLERVLGETFRGAQPELSELYLQIASFNHYTVKTLTGTQTRYRPQALALTGVPALFVVGEEDVLFPPSLIRKAWREVPGADWITLEKAGHSAYFEAAESFNRLVGHWLEACVGKFDPVTHT
ncbi:alpha/beta fold hydrolase [Pandoraea terrigena]|uniref:AB hydrolase superfamily protein YdjP n=1 Tax=Pandoraea terrigena TaxID=2508292 RepID=A0A5E4VH31_9BURK|nr:alpha/beta hydrolase [Pandoraea terrigena]VVE10230.1 AB hydrolase superfamily protein YdjP [Pandoraea terrigena]